MGNRRAEETMERGDLGFMADFTKRKSESKRYCFASFKFNPCLFTYEQ